MRITEFLTERAQDPDRELPPWYQWLIRQPTGQAIMMDLGLGNKPKLRDILSVTHLDVLNLELEYGDQVDKQLDNSADNYEELFEKYVTTWTLANKIQSQQLR